MEQSKSMCEMVNHRFENTACCLFVCLVACLLGCLFVCFFLCFFDLCETTATQTIPEFIFSTPEVTLEASDKNASAKRTVNGAAREEGPAAGPSPGSSFFSIERWFLGGGNSNIFYFQPYVGKMSNLTNILQMG